jgi:hypothetical protein
MNARAACCRNISQAAGQADTDYRAAQAELEAARAANAGIDCAQPRAAVSIEQS